MKTVRTIIKYLIISLLALLIFIPFWDMVVNSFKTAQESAIPTIKLPTKWQILDNYKTVIKKGKLISAFKNSLLITASSTVLIITVSTMAAYVFGRRKEKKIRLFFFLFLMGIITPPSLIVSTLMLKQMGLLGTRNYRSMQLEGAHRIDGRNLKSFVIRNITCPRCAVHCKAEVELKEGKYAHPFFWSPFILIGK